MLIQKNLVCDRKQISASESSVFFSNVLVAESEEAEILR